MDITIVFSDEVKAAAAKFDAFSQTSFAKYDHNGDMLDEAITDFRNQFCNLVEQTLINEQVADEQYDAFLDAADDMFFDDINEMCEVVLGQDSVVLSV